MQARALRIPLKMSFKHASAARQTSESVWVEVSRGELRGIGEGCPRPYVTGETIEGALAWIDSVRKDALSSSGDLFTLCAWVARNELEIDRHPAAWCALETALLDLMAREREVTIEGLLGVPELAGDFRYTAVVGDDSPEATARQLDRYAAGGFGDFKFKLSGDLARDRARLALVPAGATVRVDANNLWKNAPAEAGEFLAQLGTLSGVEEPVAARDTDGLQRLASQLRVPMILDESLCTRSDLKLYENLPGADGEIRWIVNLRVSKMGGLLRSLRLIEELKRLDGWAIVVGAQVGETSVLTRLALTAARAAQTMLIAQEGAFGTLLLERDAVAPVLMFGAGGVLNYQSPAGQFGLALNPQ